MAEIKLEMEKKNSVPERKTEPLISRDQIVSTKKPIGKKLSENLLANTGEDLKTWFIFDVLIPGAKDAFMNFMNMMFYGEPRKGSDRYGSSRIFNYRGCYDGGSSSSRSTRQRNNYRSKDDLDCRHVVLEQRIAAESLVDEMRKRIRDNGAVSVAEMFDLLDVPGRITDNNYGWDDERDIGIRKIASGFLIDVTEPRYIK